MLKKVWSLPYIVTFYFTPEKVERPKQLYFKKPYGNSKGLDQLYNLASEIEPYSPIFDLLEERGWDIDYTKKSKLFVKANNIEIYEEFFEVLNIFVNGNNILGDMISKIKINDYIIKHDIFLLLKIFSKIKINKSN